MKKVLAICMICLLMYLYSCASTQTVTLLTVEEAGREDAPEETGYGFALIETKSATGPIIKVIEPSPNVDHKTPLKLMIDFVPKEGTQVDVESFKLEALKLIPINVTDRVINYVTPNGVHVEKADFPPGEHKLRVTLKDTKNGLTQMIFFVKITR